MKTKHGRHIPFLPPSCREVGQAPLSSVAPRLEFSAATRAGALLSVGTLVAGEGGPGVDPAVGGGLAILLVQDFAACAVCFGLCLGVCLDLKQTVPLSTRSSGVHTIYIIPERLLAPDRLVQRAALGEGST